MIVKHAGNSTKKFHIVKNGVWDKINYPVNFIGNWTQRDDHMQVNFGGTANIQSLTRAYFKGAKKIRITVVADFNFNQFYGWFKVVGKNNWLLTNHFGTVRKQLVKTKLQFYIDLEILEQNGQVPLLTYATSNNSWGAECKIYEIYYEDLTNEK